MFRKLILVFSFLIIFTSCSRAPIAGPTPTATFKTPAERIVSLTPGNTEILFAVGAGKQVLARDMFSDFPEAARSLQDIGGSSDQYNTEAIIALHPDLVLAGEINSADTVAALQKLGLPVYYLKNPTSLEEMYANLETVGELTGHQGEAAALVDSLKTRVAAVDAKIAPLSSRMNVYYELDATDPTKPYTAGAGTFVDLLIARAGGFNIGETMQAQWGQISLEQVVSANPAVILLGDAAYGTSVASVKQRPGWEGIAAVQNDRVFALDDNLVSRPGPRLVDGLEEIARLLRPDLFK